jgi:hypothetical protein
VARNLCVDTVRSRQRTVVSDSMPEGFAPESTSPDRPIELEEERASVRQALAGLSERHRELLYLRDVEGVAYEDLAEKLGVSVEGARAVLFRARRCLQHQLKAMAEGAAGLVALVRVRSFAFARRMGGAVLPVEGVVAPMLQPVLGLLLGLGVAAGASPVTTPQAPPSVPVTLAPVGLGTAVPTPAGTVRVTVAAPSAGPVEAVPVGPTEQAPHPPAFAMEPQVKASVDPTASSATVDSSIKTPAGSIPVAQATTYRTGQGTPSVAGDTVDSGTGTTCQGAAATCQTLKNGTTLGGVSR